MSLSPTISKEGISSLTGAEFGTLLSAHSDARRDLGALFNGEDMKQVKIVAMKDAGVEGGYILGGHMHPYCEMFTVASGAALFRLFDQQSGGIEYYLLTPGKRLVIPKEVPHDAFVLSETFLIGATERAYTNPDVNDFAVTIPLFTEIEKALALPLDNK